MKKITVEEQFSMEELLDTPDTISEALERKIEGRLKDMDKSGIDMQVISCVFQHSSFDKASEATAAVKKVNDQIARIAKKYPERFAAFASIAAEDANAAAKELERAVKDLGCKAGMVASNVKGEYYDNQKYWPIFEMAEKLDVPIYLHPSVPSPDMIKPFQTYPVLARAMWGFAAEAGLSAMRLICSGVFDKYSGLKIILGHMGEGIPYWLWRIDNRWDRAQDVEPDVEVYVVKLRKKPAQYFRDNFYITTSGMFWPPVLQFACSVLGDDKILFAVDYPQESNKVAVEFIESTPLSDSAKEKICHLNTEKLLRL